MVVELIKKSLYSQNSETGLLEPNERGVVAILLFIFTGIVFATFFLAKSGEGIIDIQLFIRQIIAIGVIVGLAVLYTRWRIKSSKSRTIAYGVLDSTKNIQFYANESHEALRVRRYVKTLITVSLIFLFFVESGLSLIMTVMIFSGVFLLGFKNWARRLFIVTAWLMIIVNLLNLFSLLFRKNEVLSVASEAGIPPELLVVFVAIICLFSIIFYGYGIYLLNQRDIKNLFCLMPGSQQSRVTEP